MGLDFVPRHTVANGVLEVKVVIFIRNTWMTSLGGPLFGGGKNGAVSRVVAQDFGKPSLFALLDEAHQHFVPGRDAELADLVLDAMGMGVALIVIGEWYCVRERPRVADRGGA